MSRSSEQAKDKTNHKTTARAQRSQKRNRNRNRKKRKERKRKEKKQKQKENTASTRTTQMDQQLKRWGLLVAASVVASGTTKKQTHAGTSSSPA